MKQTSLNLRKIIILIIVTSIFFLALIMRLGMVNQTKVSIPIRADAKEYYSYAINLKTEGIYSKQFPSTVGPLTLKADKHRPPGYALFLFPFVEYPPTFEMINNIVITQALISTLTVLLCFFLFRLLLPTSLSIISMFLVAISPHLIAMDIYLLTESLFTFFLVLLSYCTSKLVLKQNIYWAYTTGCILGVSLLIKPTMTYFFVFLFFGLTFLLNKKGIKKILIFILAGYITSYGPWTLYKNSEIGDQPSSLTQVSIHNGMYIGLMHNNNPKTKGIPHRADPDYNKIKNTNALFKKLFNRIQQNPLEYLKWYFIDKPTMFFSWNIVAGMGDIFIYPIHHSPYQSLGLYQYTHRIMLALHTPLMILGSIITILLWLPITNNFLPRKTLLVGRTLSLIIFYFIIVHSIATPLPRYSIPLRPIMYSFALISFLYIHNIFRNITNKEKSCP